MTPLDNTLLSFSAALPKPSTQLVNKKKFELYTKRATAWIEPESFVDELLTTQGNHFIGWLDSSRKASPYSRMSILSIDPALQFTYSTLHKELKTTDRNGKETISQLQDTFFDYVSTLLAETGKPHCIDRDISDLEFQGGLMGYFGYEMKRESMQGYTTPKEQECHCKQHGQLNCCPCVEEPDAAFQFIDRFLVFDQVKKQIYICCLVSKDKQDVGFHQIDDALNWINEQQFNILKSSEILRKRKLLDEFISLTPVSSACSTPTPSIQLSTISNIFTADVQHQDYLETIEQCVENIRQGEAYEICLTTRFRLNLPKHITTEPTDPTLWRLYTRYLRKNNPAPFSALIMFPRLGVLSSSPERFLKVSSDHVAEMKPIKGTVARVLSCICKEGTCDFGQECQEKQQLKDELVKQQLWQDVKERAENLMVKEKKRHIYIAIILMFH